ncbi:MAG: class I SAM-dependent methyltransferase, partial [Candidatus Omnitrophica bacterium]|nr:class I SAM-dependent methyltransferase [Candidatus Omnitrophota bacterium]
IHVAGREIRVELDAKTGETVLRHEWKKSTKIPAPTQEMLEGRKPVKLETQNPNKPKLELYYSEGQLKFGGEVLMDGKPITDDGVTYVVHIFNKTPESELTEKSAGLDTKEIELTLYDEEKTRIEDFSKPVKFKLPHFALAKKRERKLRRARDFLFDAALWTSGSRAAALSRARALIQEEYKKKLKELGAKHPDHVLDKYMDAYFDGVYPKANFLTVKALQGWQEHLKEEGIDLEQYGIDLFALVSSRLTPADIARIRRFIAGAGAAHTLGARDVRDLTLSQILTLSHAADNPDLTVSSAKGEEGNSLTDKTEAWMDALVHVSVAQKEMAPGSNAEKRLAALRGKINLDLKDKDAREKLYQAYKQIEAVLEALGLSSRAGFLEIADAILLNDFQALRRLAKEADIVIPEDAGTLEAILAPFRQKAASILQGIAEQKFKSKVLFAKGMAANLYQSAQQKIAGAGEAQQEKSTEKARALKQEAFLDLKDAITALTTALKTLEHEEAARELKAPFLADLKASLGRMFFERFKLIPSEFDRDQARRYFEAAMDTDKKYAALFYEELELLRKYSGGKLQSRLTGRSKDEKIHYGYRNSEVKPKEPGEATLAEVLHNQEVLNENAHMKYVLERIHARVEKSASEINSMAIDIHIDDSLKEDEIISGRPEIPGFSPAKPGLALELNRLIRQKDKTQILRIGQAVRNAYREGFAPLELDAYREELTSGDMASISKALERMVAQDDKDFLLEFYDHVLRRYGLSAQIDWVLAANKINEGRDTQAVRGIGRMGRQIRVFIHYAEWLAGLREAFGEAFFTQYAELLLQGDLNEEGFGHSPDGDDLGQYHHIGEMEQNMANDARLVFAGELAENQALQESMILDHLLILKKRKRLASLEASLESLRKQLPGEQRAFNETHEQILRLQGNIGTLEKEYERRHILSAAGGEARKKARELTQKIRGASEEFLDTAVELVQRNRLIEAVGFDSYYVKALKKEMKRRTGKEWIDWKETRAHYGRSPRGTSDVISSNAVVIAFEVISKWELGRDMDEASVRRIVNEMIDREYHQWHWLDRSGKVYTPKPVIFAQLIRRQSPVSAEELGRLLRDIENGRPVESPEAIREKIRQGLAGAGDFEVNMLDIIDALQRVEGASPEDIKEKKLLILREAEEAARQIARQGEEFWKSLHEVRMKAVELEVDLERGDDRVELALSKLAGNKNWENELIRRTREKGRLLRDDLLDEVTRITNAYAKERVTQEARTQFSLADETSLASIQERTEQNISNRLESMEAGSVLSQNEISESVDISQPNLVLAELRGFSGGVEEADLNALAGDLRSKERRYFEAMPLEALERAGQPDRDFYYWVKDEEGRTQFRVLRAWQIQFLRKNKEQKAKNIFKSTDINRLETYLRNAVHVDRKSQRRVYEALMYTQVYIGKQWAFDLENGLGIFINDRELNGYDGRWGYRQMAAQENPKLLASKFDYTGDVKVRRVLDKIARDKKIAARRAGRPALTTEQAIGEAREFLAEKMIEGAKIVMHLFGRNLGRGFISFSPAAGRNVEDNLGLVLDLKMLRKNIVHELNHAHFWINLSEEEREEITNRLRKLNGFDKAASSLIEESGYTMEQAVEELMAYMSQNLIDSDPSVITQSESFLVEAIRMDEDRRELERIYDEFAFSAIPSLVKRHVTEKGWPGSDYSQRLEEERALDAKLSSEVEQEFNEGNLKRARTKYAELRARARDGEGNMLLVDAPREVAAFVGKRKLAEARAASAWARRVESQIVNQKAEELTRAKTAEAVAGYEKAEHLYRAVTRNKQLPKALREAAKKERASVAMQIHDLAKQLGNEERAARALAVARRSDRLREDVAKLDASMILLDKGWMGKNELPLVPQEFLSLALPASIREGILSRNQPLRLSHRVQITPDEVKAVEAYSEAQKSNVELFLQEAIEGMAAKELRGEASLLASSEPYRQWYFSQIRSLMKERLERAGREAVPIKILSVGSGTGEHELALQNLGFAVTGLELDEARAKVARQKGLEVIEGDAHRASHWAGEAQFDAVIFSETMGNLGLQKAIAEAYKTLVPGGRILITDGLGNVPDIVSGNYRRENRYNLYPGGMIQNHLREAGFQAIQGIPVPQEIAEGQIFITAIKPAESGVAASLGSQPLPLSLSEGEGRVRVARAIARIRALRPGFALNPAVTSGVRVRSFAGTEFAGAPAYADLETGIIWLDADYVRTASVDSLAQSIVHEYRHLLNIAEITDSDLILRTAKDELSAYSAQRDLARAQGDLATAGILDLFTRGLARAIAGYAPGEPLNQLDPFIRAAIRDQASDVTIGDLASLEAALESMPKAAAAQALRLLSAHQSSPAFYYGIQEIVAAATPAARDAREALASRRLSFLAMRRATSSAFSAEVMAGAAVGGDMSIKPFVTTDMVRTIEDAEALRTKLDPNSKVTHILMVTSELEGEIRASKSFEPFLKVRTGEPYAVLELSVGMPAGRIHRDLIEEGAVRANISHATRQAPQVAETLAFTIVYQDAQASLTSEEESLVASFATAMAGYIARNGAQGLVSVQKFADQNHLQFNHVSDTSITLGFQSIMALVHYLLQELTSERAAQQSA